MPITSRFPRTTDRRALKPGDLFVFENGESQGLAIWTVEGELSRALVLATDEEDRLPTLYHDQGLPNLVGVVEGPVSVEPLSGFGTPANDLPKAGSVWAAVGGDIRIRTAGLRPSATWWSLATGAQFRGQPEAHDLVYHQWRLVLRRPHEPEVELVRWGDQT